jgi:GT2 family glycosyltransferase
VAIPGSRPEAHKVFGLTLYWNNSAEYSEYTERYSMREIGVRPNMLYKLTIPLVLLLQKEASAPNACRVLVLREVFEKIGGFDEVLIKSK